MADPRRLHVCTVRVPEDWHALFERQAKAKGVSVAAYFREAALLRWAFESGRTGLRESPAEVAEVAEEIERLSARLHELYGMPRSSGD